VHFGGHALLDPLSPSGNRLLFAAEPGNDSLSAGDIVGIRLRATEVVVLSACRTLPGGRGRESLNGLAAAFLGAGPRVVISGQWEGEDLASRDLLVAFHKGLRLGEKPASALRNAQLLLLHGPNVALRSPTAWGGYEAIGGAIGN
jgi:CHAT domain-containing protein